MVEIKLDRLIAAGLFAIAGVLLIIEAGKVFLAIPLLLIAIILAIWGLIEIIILLAFLTIILYFANKYGVIQMMMDMFNAYF